MRALSLTISVILLTLAATEVSASPTPKSHSCRISTGYGTIAMGYGSSKIEAKANARELCGTKIIDGYLAQRGNIDESAVDDLALACVNKECE